jgi:FKBP-type peptidyl-prolyl cis-trans isomerase (trigger factor)
MTREEIKRRLDQLAREYIETHNPEIAVELYRLARELETMEEGVIEIKPQALRHGQAR